MFGLGTTPLSTNALGGMQSGDSTSAAMIVSCSCMICSKCQALYDTWTDYSHGDQGALAVLLAWS